MVKLMQLGFSKLTSLISNDAVVSPATGFAAIGEYLLGFLTNLLTSLYELIIRVLMTITNFLLVFIDFIFVFIRQIIGIDINFSDLSTLGDTDLVFKFLLSDSVTTIVRTLFALAVVLIIIFSILAIIKNEYVAATTGAPNSKKAVLVSAMKSLLMMILVPIVFIGGLIMSNAILKSLDNITSGGTNQSMASQIFIASTYQANAYRNYAQDNLRIPITYNFSEVDEEGFFDHATTGTVAELESAYKAFSEKSGWDRGFTTYLMFHNNTFSNLDEIERADDEAMKHNEVSWYHATYDKGLYMRQAEYLIMGDVIEYAIENDITFYFKTPQDIWASWGGNPSSDQEWRTLFKKNTDGSIEFNVYFSGNHETVTYTSKNNGSIQDEAKGSVFLICTRNEDDKLVPLVDGLNFSTIYSSGNSPVIARGLFDDGYPTAIREEGNIVKFYRDKLNVPFITDLLPVISYEKPEGGTTDIGGFLSGGFKLVTGLDLNDFIPYVYFNFDVLRLFNKSYRTLTTFEDGGFRLNYLFNDDGVAFSHFYNYKEVNIIVLVVVTSVVFGLLFKVLFGALARVFDLVMLFVTYPAVCATIPIDNGTIFSNWVKQTVGITLSIYGVIVGLNLIMMLYPVIDSITFFTASDFETLSGLKFIPADWTASFMNILIQFLMTFALFGLLNTTIKMLNQLMNPKNYKEGAFDIVSRGGTTIGNTKAMIKNVSDTITGKKLLDGVNELKNTTVGMIPGSAVFSAVKDKIKFGQTQSEMADSRNDLAAAMKSGNTPQTEAMTKRVESTTKKHSK